MEVGSPTTFVGLANYVRLPNDPRFVEWGATRSSTPSCRVAAADLGTLAAVVFHQKFPGRGFSRGFIMPMMATPVANRAGLDHDVHPQLAS